jgi:tetratricopeptide (TPR) repeat protein
MKKILLCALVMAAGTAFAQKSNLNKANVALNAVTANPKEMNYEKLDEAWELIQLAMEHPQTSVMADTWNTAARIQAFYMNKMLNERNVTGQLDTKKFFENQKMIVEFYSKCDVLEHTPNKKGKLPKEIYRPLNQSVAKGARANLRNAGGMLAVSDPELSIMYINYYNESAKNSIFTGLTDIVDPDSVMGDINYYLATAYKTKGDEENAVLALEKALASKQYGKFACGELVMLCDKLGKTEMKDNYINYGYEHYKDMSQYGQWKLSALLAKQDWEASLALCDELITNFPDDKFAYYNKGRVLYELKKYEEATDAYARAAEVDSDNAEALSMAGRSAMMIAQLNASDKKMRDEALKTAIEFFHRVESAFPDKSDLYGYELYVCYTNLGQTAKAKPYKQYYSK